MKKLTIDTAFLTTTLLELLAIPSPAGLTDEIVHYTARKLDALGLILDSDPRRVTKTGIAQRDDPAAPEPARAESDQ